MCGLWRCHYRMRAGDVLSDDDVLKLVLTDLVLAAAALLAAVPGPGGGGLQHRQPEAVIHTQLHHALLHQEAHVEHVLHRVT